jgi:hypothetical protein
MYYKALPTMSSRSAKTRNSQNCLNPDAEVNSYQGYIINMNDKLKREYDEMKAELESVKLELAIRDDELDREEKSNTNLRGATHNINSLNQLNQKIKKQYIRYQASTEELIKTRNTTLKSIIINHCIFIMLSLFICMVMLYMNMSTGHIIFHITWNIIDLGITLRIEPGILKKINKDKDPDIVLITNKYMPVIRQHMSDIHELVLANDYLSEYIDSL